jgi:NAD(P)-dependent dehydrogenase (short-subunit alcohol dehydrogenase family)
MSDKKSAVITGGSSGIGAAVAAALAEAGYGITIAGRRGEALEKTAAQLRGIAENSTAGDATSGIRTQVTDVGQADQIKNLFDGHVAHFGSINALITAAAAYEPVSFLDLTPQAWAATVDVALTGSVLAAAEAARHMKATGGGRIVLFSSINGFHSEPESVHYSAAKAAIISVAKTLAVDLAGTGVIANAIAPGWVYTPMTAEFIDQTTPEQLRRINTLGRVGRPEEIAGVVRYLVTEAPEFLVGTTIFVDGGQTALAPMP